MNKFKLKKRDLVRFHKATVTIDRSEIDLNGLHGIVRYSCDTNDTYDLDEPTTLISPHSPVVDGYYDDSIQEWVNGDNYFRIDFQILNFDKVVGDPHIQGILMEFSKDYYNEDTADIITIGDYDNDYALIHDMIFNEQKHIELIANLNRLK